MSWQLASLVLYWTFCNVFVPLLTIPSTFFLLWFKKKIRLMNLVSDGQLCLYSCAVCSSAAYDISREVWKTYETIKEAVTTNETNLCLESLNNSILLGSVTVLILLFWGWFVCGGFFSLLTFLGITNRLNNSTPGTAGVLSDEGKLSVISVLLTLSSIILVILFRIVTKVI